YSFRIKTAACDAQVTRTRTWSRKLVAPDIGETPSSREEAIAAAGAAEPSAAAQSNESPVQAPDTQPETVERSDNCASPGAPHSIELPQLVQWLEPGRTLQLKPQVRDERGCRIRKAKLTYRFEPPADQLQVDERTGMVRVAADAEQGSYSLTIRSGGASRVVEIPVLSKDGMAALLGSPNQVAAPLSSSQARPVGVWGQLGAAAARAEDTATPRKWAFAGLAGLIVLGLAALGFRLLRTGTRPSGLSVAHRPSMGDGAITVRSAVETPAAESPGWRPLASSVRP